MLLGYPPRQAIAVTIHAPSGDGNAAYRPCRSDPRHVTIHAPSGDGNNDYGSAFEYQRVTIHAPSGDGNTLELDHIPVLGCYNPRPVRGRKYPEGWFQVPDPALQSTPRQGTEISSAQAALRATDVTIHAPSGDGNDIVAMLCLLYAVTIHAPSGDGNRSTLLRYLPSYVTIHAPSGDGNSEQNILSRVC